MNYRARIYLAGPDVFYPDPRTIAAQKKAICAELGFEGVFPLDAELDLSSLTPHEAGYRIYLADTSMMRSCDLAIANMTPFRGPSMDVGTAFEMGFMRALGKLVLGYTNDAASYLERIKASSGLIARAPGDPAGPGFVDRDGFGVENFDMADNLMLEGAVIESGASIVVNAVAKENRDTDLAGFRKCVQLAGQLRSKAP